LRGRLDLYYHRFTIPTTDGLRMQSRDVLRDAISRLLTVGAQNSKSGADDGL
jgi:hypothetical protein